MCNLFLCEQNTITGLCTTLRQCLLHIISKCQQLQRCRGTEQPTCNVARAETAIGTNTLVRPGQALLAAELEWLFEAFEAAAPHGGVIGGAGLASIKAMGQASDPRH